MPLTGRQRIQLYRTRRNALILQLGGKCIHCGVKGPIAYKFYRDGLSITETFAIQENAQTLWNSRTKDFIEMNKE